MGIDYLELGYFFENMAACPCREYFDGITYPWEAHALKNKNFSLETKLDIAIPDNVVIRGDVQIGKGTVIYPFVMIEGPVKIGENCEIRPGALIRPNTIIGDYCTIGHNAEIKNSILFNEAKVSTNSFVGDSILGLGARVASGAITGNRRFDQKDISIKLGDQAYNVGDKFGCIIGDYSRLGANTVISPGILVGMHSWIYSNALIRDHIPKDSLIKVKHELEIITKMRYALKQEDNSGKR